MKVDKSKINMLKIFIKNKNNRHVKNEAIVPGAYFIFPILNRVRKNKLNSLIIFYNRGQDF